MKIEFHRHFIKCYKNALSKVKCQFEKRLSFFEKELFHPLLNNHLLSGNKKGQWSINVTGDWCAIYIFKDKNTVVFIDIDTHSNLYQ